MTSDVLFELGTEELPSAAVAILSQALADGVVAGLTKANVTHGAVRCFATPRRLALLIADVAGEQPNQIISRRGPSCATAVDITSPSLIGFAKSCGVAVTELTRQETDKGGWWVYEAESKGQPTSALLPSILTDALAALPIVKPMRWGNGEVAFARPVHWAVLLFGTEVIACSLLGVTTGRYSRGHRFHHPEAIEITTPNDYEALLQQAFVVADFSERRRMIREQVEGLAAEHGAHAVIPEALLDEVTSIVEWPSALLANFDASFLDIPAEVLIAAMQSHQKCFALRDDAGRLLPHFITVANINSRSPEHVILGNEKVMRARLSDAAFFYRQDQRHPLEQYYAATANVVFQAKLGSLQDKMVRLEALITHLLPYFHCDANDALRAAHLSKCDLMTGMVGEFPELQGLMGYYYALASGENATVAAALQEHYFPRFANDDLPSSPLGMALSLADRIDTLVGAFLLGQKPSGVKDPFKLRRHALAVIRLLMATPVAISLSDVMAWSEHGYGSLLPPNDARMAELKAFLLERLPAFYQQQGIAASLIDAVCARQDDDLWDLDLRVQALFHFVSQPEAVSLTAAAKRVGHLLQQASFTMTSGSVDAALLQNAAEKDLWLQLQRVQAVIEPLYVSRQYAVILGQLATLRAPVDAFFDGVMVMVDDVALKHNRLQLLAQLQILLQGVALLSLL